MIIDTHIHLDSSEFQHDLSEVIQRAKDSNIESMLIPGASLYSLQNAIDIANNNECIYYAVGIHPYHIDEITIDNTDKSFVFNEMVLQSVKESILLKCRAIGECGLDYYRLDKDFSKEIHKQIECFKMQIELAIKYDLPLILHVRDSVNDYEASKEVANILNYYIKNGKNLRGVFHCYNACDILLEFCETFYYGIGGIVTFKNANNLVNILPKIPLDRLLLETDAPYLAPVPHRGKRNESSLLPHVVYKISEILGIGTQELEAITTSNAKRLFSL